MIQLPVADHRQVGMAAATERHPEAMHPWIHRWIKN
jgi:hypothetical protein